MDTFKAVRSNSTCESKKNTGIDLKRKSFAAMAGANITVAHDMDSLDSNRTSSLVFRKMSNILIQGECFVNKIEMEHNSDAFSSVSPTPKSILKINEEDLSLADLAELIQIKRFLFFLTVTIIHNTLYKIQNTK